MEYGRYYNSIYYNASYNEYNYNTKYGSNIYSVGGNEQVARYSGINTAMSFLKLIC